MVMEVQSLKDGLAVYDHVRGFYVSRGLRNGQQGFVRPAHERAEIIKLRWGKWHEDQNG